MRSAGLSCAVLLFVSAVSGWYAEAAGLRLATRLKPQGISAGVALAATGAAFIPRAADGCDSSALHSPYRLQHYSSTPTQDGSTVCFHVLLVPCDADATCCNGQDLFKAELDVEPSCQSSVQHVTLNGEPHSFEYSAAVLRVSGLARNATTAAGTQVCLTLEGRCRDTAALCAGGDGQCRYSLFNGGKQHCCPAGMTSPAVPPPTRAPVVIRLPAATTDEEERPAARGAAAPAAAAASTRQAVTGFPYQQCQRDASLSRYSLSDASVAPVADSDDVLTRACFKIDASNECSGGCCTFDLQKVEFEVSPACYGALAYVSVGGMLRPPFFQSATADAPGAVIKVMNLGVPAATRGGTEVCLFLRPQCGSLEQLCRRPDGLCAYSIFGAPASKGGGIGDRCCPVGLAGTVGRGALA